MSEIAALILPGVALFVNVFVLLLCLPRRYSLAFTISMFVALFILLVFLSRLFLYPIKPTEVFVLRELRALLFLALIIPLFKGRFFEKLFIYFMPMAIVTGIYFFGRLFAMHCMPDGDWYWFAVFTVTLFLFLVYAVLVFKFGRGIIKKLFAHGTEKEWALYTLAAVIAYYIQQGISPLLEGNALAALFFNIFIFWSLFILCYTIINVHEKFKNKYESDFQRNIISSGVGHYEKITERFDALQIARHDYKYHLNAARELLRRGEIEAGDEYLSGLQTKLEQTELPNFCLNAVINSLLSDYAQRCMESDIAFDASVSLPPEYPIPNYEMCIVLGNLLENAVEACQKLTANRIIMLIVKEQGEGQLAILVRNTFGSELIMDGEQFVSTKKGGGIGLASVRAVVERYGEEFVTKAEAGWFSAMVLWKRAEGKEPAA